MSVLYVIKTWEYKSSLRKLIYKLRISFANKNIRIKLEILFAFLSNKKIGGQLSFLRRSFLFSKSFDQNYGKAI